MDTDKIINSFAQRGSVRTYDEARTVDPALLTRILDAATHAPTTGNMQLYSVVVTRDAENRGRLARLHLGQPAACNAPVLLTFCADVRRFDRWCDARSAQRSLDNAGGYLMAITDAAIYAQQVNTLAELCGLGCVYLGTVTYDLDGFADALGLPAGVLPLFTIAIGYPATPASPSSRLPLKAVVHDEQYRDADIDDTYADLEAEPQSAAYVAENNLQTLAQVFSQVRYPLDLNRRVAAAIHRRTAVKP